MDWLDLLAVQGTLMSLLQHHSSKASIFQHSAFFTVQLSHPYMTTGKTIALTRRTFFGKVMSLLFNMLSRLVIIFLPRSKHLLLSWLQSPSAVILEPKNCIPHFKSGISSYVMDCPFINWIDLREKDPFYFSMSYLIYLNFTFVYKTQAHSLGSYVYLLSSLGNNLAILWLLRLLFS